MLIRRLLLAAAVLLVATDMAPALDHVVLKRDGRRIRIAGKLVVEAQDGGLLLMAPDSVLWAVQPEELIRHDQDDDPFVPLDRKQLTTKLLAELPDDFHVHTTKHYVICYNTSKVYAQWCGALYERLYKAFQNFWSRRGCKLHEPDVPLVALVFDDKASYARYAETELGDRPGSIIGYYSLRTNRITTYDLTGIDSLRKKGGSYASVAQINRVLAGRDAERTVATIIHEATHQIAFNCGLQTRYADIPLWLSEGIAVYFETPDLKRSKGWPAIGAINRPRLARFRAYCEHRPADSLASLITDDYRFRDRHESLDAYSEAWALTYHLIRRRPKQFVQYLQVLSEKEPLFTDTPETRLAEFKAAFGDDLERIDVELLRKVRDLR